MSIDWPYFCLSSFILLLLCLQQSCDKTPELKSEVEAQEKEEKTCFLLRFSLQIFTVSWVLQSSGAATCSQHIAEPFGPICSQQTVTCSLRATVSEWRRIPHTRPNLNLSFQYQLTRISRQDFHFYRWMIWLYFLNIWAWIHVLLLTVLLFKMYYSWFAMLVH